MIYNLFRPFSTKRLHIMCKYAVKRLPAHTKTGPTGSESYIIKSKRSRGMEKPLVIQCCHSIVMIMKLKIENHFPCV